MPENGSVNSSSGSSNSTNSSGSSSSSSSDNSSNESQTTEESLSSSPTTGDTLSGGQEASNSNDSNKSSDSGKSDSNKSDSGSESNKTDTHTNGDSDSDKANENRNNSNDNQSNNSSSNQKAANDDINNLADSGKNDFNNRSATSDSKSNAGTTNNTGTYDEVPSVAVSRYEASVEIELPETETDEPEPKPSLPEGVPNEYAEYFGATPNPTGGVDAIRSNPDGSFTSSDGSTYNPATGEKSYDVAEDSFAVPSKYGTQMEKHPDRVRSGEALAVVEADPNNMAKAHGNQAAFDYYSNPNIDSIREQAYDQVQTRKSLAEGKSAEIGEALSNPADGLEGLAKGMANGFLDLVELGAKGSIANAASQQYQAAAFSSLVGNDALSEKQMQLADDLKEASKEDYVPSFELENAAQRGGATIGLAIDVATGVKGLATGLGKLGAKNVDEVAGAATDSTAGRQTGGGSQADPADEMYEAIRASETDVKSIAENTGFKEANVEKVKNHVFHEEHVLDRFVAQGEPAEIKARNRGELVRKEVRFRLQ